MQGCSLSDALRLQPPLSSYRPIVPSPRASLSPMAQCAAARLPCVRPNAPRAARPVARCAWHLRGGRCSVCTHSAHAHASCIMHHASCDGMSSLCSAPERARGSARLSRPGKRRCSPAGCAAVGATWTRWAAARSRVAGRRAGRGGLTGRAPRPCPSAGASPRRPRASAPTSPRRRCLRLALQ